MGCVVGNQIIPIVIRMYIYTCPSFVKIRVVSSTISYTHVYLYYYTTVCYVHFRYTPVTVNHDTPAYGCFLLQQVSNGFA